MLPHFTPRSSDRSAHPTHGIGSGNTSAAAAGALSTLDPHFPAAAPAAEPRSAAVNVPLSADPPPYLARSSHFIAGDADDERSGAVATTPTAETTPIRVRFPAPRDTSSTAPARPSTAVACAFAEDATSPYQLAPRMASPHQGDAREHASLFSAAKRQALGLLAGVRFLARKMGRRLVGSNTLNEKQSTASRVDGAALGSRLRGKPRSPTEEDPIRHHLSSIAPSPFPLPSTSTLAHRLVRRLSRARLEQPPLQQQRRRNHQPQQRRRRHLPFLRQCASVCAAVVAIALLLGFVFDLYIGMVLKALGADLAGARHAQDPSAPSAALPHRTPESAAEEEDRSAAPFLACDCAGVDAMGDLADVRGALAAATSVASSASATPSPPGNAVELVRRLATMERIVTPTCGLCTSLAAALSRDVLVVTPSGALVWKEELLPPSRWKQPFVFLSNALSYTVTFVLTRLTALSFSHTAFVVAKARQRYEEYREAGEAQLLQDRQNRGLLGHVIDPPTLWSFLATSLAESTAQSNRASPDHYSIEEQQQRALAEAIIAPPTVYFVADGEPSATYACRENTAIDRLYFSRHALPWLQIDAAMHRTQDAWVVDPRGRERLLPFATPMNQSKRAWLRATWLQSGRLHAGEDLNLLGNERQLPRRPEITVAVTSPTSRFMSFFCDDMPNVSRHGTYYVDPNRKAILDRTLPAAPREERGSTSKPPDAHSGTHDEDVAARTRNMEHVRAEVTCSGCTFHCVHPRLLRRRGMRARQPQQQQARRQHRRPDADEQTTVAAMTEDEATPYNGAISWDVVLEDVDAGLVRLPRVQGKRTDKTNVRWGVEEQNVRDGDDEDQGGDIKQKNSSNDREQYSGYSNEEHVVAREDLFTCKVLNRHPARLYDKHGASTQEPDNRALLLSTDVWLTHFAGGLPLFFVNQSRMTDPKRVQRTGAGQQHRHKSSSNDNNSHHDAVPAPWTPSRWNASAGALARLLPVHTAAVYGESLQSFPDYALRASYWAQFDDVYLQQKVRRPELLSPATRRHTTFSTWTITHLYLREFQLIAYLNRQRRSLQTARRRSEGADASPEPDPSPPPPPSPLHRQLEEEERQGGAAAVSLDAVLTVDDLEGAVHRHSGVLPRLALELLYGADPLMLPMRGEHLFDTSARTVAWYPPTSASWANKVSLPHSLPFSSSGRMPAIVTAISHCWHGRLWWLSELSRYYPVHNFGRCVIPTPSPLPGDAKPTPGIPQRASYPFPSECHPSRLAARHQAALALARARTVKRARQPFSSSSATPAPPFASHSEGRARTPVHMWRDYELRCVFRKYKYVLAFENSIEDDYVTEKVYNAMLSGALPLYVGAMNVEQYVPRTAVRNATEGRQQKTRGGAAVTRIAAASKAKRGATAGSSSVGLAVLPVLQMFPVLNETATRLEERRVMSLHEVDEAVSRQVLTTHATVLRTRAAAAVAQATTASPERWRGGEVAARPSIGTEQLARAHPLGEEATVAVPASLEDSAVITAGLVAAALESVAQQASHNTSRAHFLLYSPAQNAEDAITEERRRATARTTVGPAQHPPTAAAADSERRVGRSWASPLGGWPCLPMQRADNGSGPEDVVDFGQYTFLRRVHRAVVETRRQMTEQQQHGGQQTRQGTWRAGGETEQQQQRQQRQPRVRDTNAATAAPTVEPDAPIVGNTEDLKSPIHPASSRSFRGTSHMPETDGAPFADDTPVWHKRPSQLLRRVRYRADRTIALTMNTAFAFFEEVQQHRQQQQHRTPGEAAAGAHKDTHMERLPAGADTDRPVTQGEQFNALQAEETVPPHDGIGGTRETAVTPPHTLRSPGGLFSKHFVRRTLPVEVTARVAEAGRTAPMGPRDTDTAVTNPDAAFTDAKPPLNGFGQLAAYLRQLDADHTLADRHGYFEWWRAERMADYGAAFLEQLYVPHPICSICAAALEKKEKKEGVSAMT